VAAALMDWQVAVIQLAAVLAGIGGLIGELILHHVL
jgi:hypothetical protein